MGCPPPYDPLGAHALEVWDEAQYPLITGYDDWEGVSGLFPETNQESKMTTEPKMKLVDGNLVRVEPTTDERIAQIEKTIDGLITKLMLAPPSEINNMDRAWAREVSDSLGIVPPMPDLVRFHSTPIEARVEVLDAHRVQHDNKIAELFEILDECAQLIETMASALVAFQDKLLTKRMPVPDIGPVEKAMARFHAALAEHEHAADTSPPPTLVRRGHEVAGHRVVVSASSRIVTIDCPVSPAVTFPVPDTAKHYVCCCGAEIDLQMAKPLAGTTNYLYFIDGHSYVAYNEHNTVAHLINLAKLPEGTQLWRLGTKMGADEVVTLGNNPTFLTQPDPSY